ncbi:MAG: hypothetical protein IJT32_00575 [Lachnospiraceae bacterium]|nr:hypothetical protein [Lachnospiraceae bacterium]
MGKSIREQFIPKKKLDFLQIDGTFEEAKQNLKTPRCIDAGVMRMGMADIDFGFDDNEAPAMFERIAAQVEHAMPSFAEWGGEVDHDLGTGVQLLFMENKTGALGAAIQARERLLKRAEMIRDMTFGLSYGKVVLGVLGGAESYSVMSFSQVSFISAFLQQVTGKYSASILVSEELIRQDPSLTSKYSCRLLGKFYFGKIKKTLKVYDFYDGDEIAVRTAKRKTDLLFDKGVSLFLAEDFARARSYFIEVIKANRGDKAARIYLSLCDTFRENPPESPEELCIERV